MNISKDLQKQLDQHIAKNEQQAFVELAVKDHLNKHIAKKTNMIELFVDGGARRNPGPAGGGFAVFKGGEKVLQGSEYFGEKTNNQAEYLALRLALRETYDQFPDANVHCYMDSQLVVEQMRGNYKVKNQNIRPLYEEVDRIAAQFKGFEIEHVEREQNKFADKLANEAMDRQK